IPVQLKPTIDPLEYNITTTYAGASALEIEDQITNKLERELASTNNLKTITSQSNEGQSTIDLLFNDDADHSAALLDIVQAVARVKDRPDDAEKPVIAKANSNGDQIMWIAVEGGSSIDQKFDLMDQLVEPALLRVDGVGGLLVSGGTKRRIMVQPNQDEMT